MRNALSVINANKQLIVFPILSALATLFAVAIFSGVLITTGTISLEFEQNSKTVFYGTVFVFYVIAYFNSIFFNMALIHCATLYFRGEEASVSKGIIFSFSRIWQIFTWAIFAATVGMVLQIVQDKLGKLVSSILGAAWNIATFFVIPVIAYEKLSPIDAVKRSGSLMREKWGESVSARFSFGIIIVLTLLTMGLMGVVLSQIVSPVLGISLAVIGILFAIVVISAVRTIITAAVYHNIDGDIDTHLNRQMLDGLFGGK